MKRTVLFFVFFISTFSLFAQNADNKWALGVEYGTLQYKGDLGDQIFDMNDWRDGFYFSLMRYLNPSFDGVLNLNYNYIDESGPILTERNRFLGRFFTGELNLRYKLNNGYIFKENARIQPFAAAGFGYMGGHSEGISLDKGSTPYDKNVGALDFYFGLGTKVRITDKISWTIEYGQVNTTKDNFDEATGLLDGNDLYRRMKTGLVITLGKAKDSDGDGVADRKDECPETPVGVQVDEKGCPVDTDGDGIADYQDDCPTVPGVPALKGCPDKDGDGIADKDDECPDVAGIPALKGCPDTDGDGVADKNDKCPGTPKGWKVDKDGCPIDTDGDGIVDAEDACPTVAGVPEEKGCPKKEKEAERVPAQTDQKIEPVYFVVDQSYITDYSKKKLDHIVNILKGNPEFLLDVYGHTDDTADEDYNMKLSQRRIDSVIAYLTSKGINGSRIHQTKAFGESKPADTNATTEGRQMNRRVEFMIMVLK
ncbi:MAG: OmpA family protein [Prolixibacteraceae bacterium]|jgi:outer membrane protein OmpA-like peptidoglycan-associated protein|nr:OmpA family protein [Prolixibacteraceae bacterium]